MVSLRAHFDGQKIILDDPFELEPDTPLIVTVLPTGESDSDHDEWIEVSKMGLARAYGEDEPEYTLDMIKKPNPEYERR